MGYGENHDSELIRTHLDAEAAKIRALRVNWKPYLQARMISQYDYDFIVTYEEAETEKERNVVFNAYREKAVYAFVHLVTQVSKDEYVRYALTELSDLLQTNRKCVEIFQETADAQKRSAFSWFLGLLHRPDPYIPHITSVIITRIASVRNHRLIGDELEYFVGFLKEQLNRGTANDFIATTVRCMQTLFRYDPYRYAFSHSNGLDSLIHALYSTRKCGFQIQYQIIFVIWLLMFNKYAAEHALNGSLISTIVTILGTCQKEKIIRIVLATLRNILTKIDDKLYRKQALLQMVQCKLQKKLELMSKRKFDDPDIADDIQYLQTELELSVHSLTSFDEYEHELRHGTLHWSPVHKCDKFWSENAQKLNENRNELLKMLLNLLETSLDPLVLCVAAHDVGEYVRYYPRGKDIVEKLGGKESMMRLLTVKDPNVRYHALLAAQKLMVVNWKLLGLSDDD
ncbi:unnamed protein product [Caenorhabditis bovis]|uniref:V-type proton ATPase subunit H n=1 Tax=Caenorhabditis bovis TaxID=2654633 RepID=A0A8S1EPS9_9PELO|nr:unnamed protein product [Caenorhabditis bovis]